jgi:hypothetical protein
MFTRAATGAAQMLEMIGNLLALMQSHRLLAARAESPHLLIRKPRLL